jgi:hypothetical protein
MADEKQTSNLAPKDHPNNKGAGAAAETVGKDASKAIADHKDRISEKSSPKPKNG